jgi:hypothetical protein
MIKISSRIFITIGILFICTMITGCNLINTSDNNDKVEPASMEAIETKEERIYSITQEINVEEKINDILTLIANVDWHTYNEKSGEKSMELIDLLNHNIIYIQPADFPNLILGTKGLDGAWSESYAAIVGQLFMRDQVDFIRALADTADLNQKKQVISLIAYNLSYQDVKPIIKELEELRTSEKSIAAEKEVINALIVDLKRKR